MKSLINIALLLTLVGCASLDPNVVVVTYDSDPPGATFKTQSGKTGYLPVDFSYSVTDEFWQGGCIELEDIQAHWRSGAILKAEGYQVCGKDGTAFNHVFTRPASPGLSMDKQKADNKGKLLMIQVIRGCDEGHFPTNIRCIKNSYSRFGTGPNSSDVKNFYSIIDGIVEDFNNNKIGLAKAKAEVIKAWQSTIDASNKRNEDAAAATSRGRGRGSAGGIDSFTRNQMYQDCLQRAAKDYRTCIP